MGPLAGKTVVVGVGAGIAAYRAGEVVRGLVREGAEVRVVMTPRASAFVAPLTFQALSRHPVLTDLLDATQDRTYGHLELARAAHLMVVVPATADLLARIRGGFADDALTSTLLATRCPVLLAPAMNTAMWENPATQDNVAALRERPNVQLVGPDSGELADGDTGVGRLASPEAIVSEAVRLLGARDLEGYRLLVTAGPTREPVDPVRYLSNRSSGKMGYAIAAAAHRRGAEVTLVSGPVALSPPAGVVLVRVTTAEEMLRAAHAALNGQHAIIAAAAVADYRPAHAAPQKIKKDDGPTSLLLERTADVLQSLAADSAQMSPRPVLVGFAAETEALEAHARAKLVAKDLDLIVANDVSRNDRGFDSDINAAVLLHRDGSAQPLGPQPKTTLAERILDAVAALIRSRSSQRLPGLS